VPDNKAKVPTRKGSKKTNRQRGAGNWLVYRTLRGNRKNGESGSAARGGFQGNHTWVYKKRREGLALGKSLGRGKSSTQSKGPYT